MAWVKRGRKLHYQRTQFMNGSYRTKYFGSGSAANLAAELDTRTRAARRQHAEACRGAQARWQALRDQQDELERSLMLLMHAQLLAAGYRLHKRGDWRRWRIPHVKSA